MGKEPQYENVHEAEGGEIGRPFFSIIVPAYNAERYIGKLLKNIDSQDFKDYELLIVNDGSTDGTREAINRYINESKNSYRKLKTNLIFIDLNENKGAAEARNIGIEKSSGIYILFLDADDEISINFLKTIYTKIKESKISNPELVVFGLIEEYLDKNGKTITKKEIVPPKIETEDINEIHKSIVDLEDITLYGYLWNKAYLSDYLKQTGIKIPRMRILEDIFFNIAYAQDVNSLVCISEALYVYKKRNEGVTSNPIPDYYEIHRERMKRLYEQYASWDFLNEDKLDKLSKTYTRYLYSALKRKDKKIRRLFLNDIYNDVIFKLLISDVNNSNESGKTAVMRTALKKKRTVLILSIVRVIEITEKYLKKLFLRLSQ